MERLRTLADLSIRRGCGFGLLAIACTMIGVAHDLALALRGGAIMMMMVWLVLLVKAHQAPARRYRDTEVWILLDKKLDEVPPDRLQATIGAVLRERYLWHAYAFAVIAAGMWVAAFLARIVL